MRVSRTTRQQRRGLRYASICSIKTREQIDGLGGLDLYASIPSNSPSILGLFTLFVTYFVILLTRFLGQMTPFRVYTRGRGGNGQEVISHSLVLQPILFDCDFPMQPDYLLGSFLPPSHCSTLVTRSFPREATVASRPFLHKLHTGASTI